MLLSYRRELQQATTVLRSPSRVATSQRIESGRDNVTAGESAKAGPEAYEELAKSKPRSMRVALDIDDTITRHPEFFAFLSKALIDSGNEVYIISYRQGQQEVEADLAVYGISFTEVVLPTTEDLGREGFYEWKAATCRRLGIEVFFEDMPEVVNELDSNVLALVPFDPDLGRLTYVEKLETP